MYKHILVPATGTEADSAVFATALQVAGLAGAHLEFLHVKTDVTQMLTMMGTGGFGAASMVQDVLEQTRAEVEAAKQKAWDHFNAFCAAASISKDPAASGGITAALAVETGSSADWLVEYGRIADLTVVGRKMGFEAMEAVLMDSGHPLLITPAKAPPALPGTVVIAWKDTQEAARAVAAAMPFIEKATRVVILSVSESAAAQAASCERLRKSLRRRNPATEFRHLPRDGQPSVEVLLAEAAKLNASLLVMGGYSHSRLRQAVFGGVTKRVLSGADLAVLMAH